MKPYILENIGNKDSHNEPILELTLKRDKYGININDFIKAVRMKYWSALFSNPKFNKKLTQNLISEYHNRVSELSNYDFSIYNIYNIRMEMHQNMILGIEDTIENLFDELSIKHHYHDETSKNIHLYDGWKTNKAWYINERVILPYMDAFRGYYDNRFSPEYQVLQKLSDIEKSLSFLDGMRPKKFH